MAGHLEINKAVGFLYQNNIQPAIDTLKAFDNKDSKVASAAATNLSFIHFLVLTYTYVKSVNRVSEIDNGVLFFFAERRLGTSGKDFDSSLRDGFIQRFGVRQSRQLLLHKTRLLQGKRTIFACTRERRDVLRSYVQLGIDQQTTRTFGRRDRLFSKAARDHEQSSRSHLPNRVVERNDWRPGTGYRMVMKYTFNVNSRGLVSTPVKTKNHTTSAVLF